MLPARNGFRVAWLDRNPQTYRLHPLSVVFKLYTLVYTQREGIRADNCVFG